MHRAILSWLAFVGSMGACYGYEEFHFHHEHVLGTRLELRMESPNFETASRAESKVLQEIDRLSTIFSSYDATSEFSRWMASKREQSISKELGEVLQRSEHWCHATRGAFHPAVEKLCRLWKEGERLQEVPSRDSLEQAVCSFDNLGWSWNPNRTAVCANGAPLTLNAIAKGYIIDALSELLEAQPDIRGGLVAIGGDMRAFGAIQRRVGIRSPVDDLAGPILSEFVLANRAMATSSGAFRGVTILGKRYSHLIDPRTGTPVSAIRSVTIIAANATDADALATACSVLPIEESIALIDEIPEAACLILDAQGEAFSSRSWKRLQPVQGKETLVSLAPSNQETQPWNGGMELKIDFTIHQAQGGRRYRRPYVAIWVEDKDGLPVRTLVLWVQSTGPGPRWIPDLKRWHKADRQRKLEDETDLVKTVSEATRKPGEYSVIWNGEDDHQKLVEPGEYTISIEAAREHGTYQIMRKKFEFKESAFQEKLEDNAEIKGANIAYRKKEQSK